MEFLKVARRRSLWSEVLYILLNLLLVAAVLVSVWAVKSPAFPIALVLLSKWRILAVRPRYWFAHILSNAVDLIVSIGLVVLLYAASGAWIAQVIIALLYALWLLLLKPRSKRSLVIAQAGVGLFVGVTSIAIVSADWYLSLVVLIFWVIGYSTARHVLLAYDEQAHVSFLSLLWAFVVAEIGWLTYHWTIAYDLPGIGSIQLPQVSIILLLLSFLAERIYGTYVRRGQVRYSDVLLPLLLSISIILVIYLQFNCPPQGTLEECRGLFY
ncbi:MAG: rane protein of unknown function [Candidatus Saccharibacteria bacterium]|nr:rane protein of unknown function [Candidatus Saccharibacteria bacterium]